MPTAQQLSVDTAASALDLANEMFGAGITIVNASYSGGAVQSGIFTGALTTLPGMTTTDSGVILSTGNAGFFAPYSDGTTDTNRAIDTTSTESGAGDPGGVTGGVANDTDLNAIAGGNTFDAAILTADFIPDGDWITLQFVFSSEEYLEWVNQGFNDVFGVWVNGTLAPVSVLDGGVASVNTVNSTTNANLYIDNPAASDLYNTEMDGLTRVLTIKAPVNAGQVNTIKLAIADSGDADLDSNVLIMGSSVQTYAIAFQDDVDMLANTSRTIDVLSNDIDYTGQGLTITHVNGAAIAPGGSVALPTGETVTLNPDGTLTIQTNSGTGASVFSYTVQDADGISDIGFVNLTVNAALAPDGIVDGTTGADLIDTAYLGDPDGDRIDNNDALGVGGTTGDDDYVLALGGDDTIRSGAGNDIVFAGSGADSVQGGLGNDLLEGGADADTLEGEAGDDTLRGDDGADVLTGGAGADSQEGGEDDDTFILADGFGDDTVIGGETGESAGDWVDARQITQDSSLIYDGDESGTLTAGADTMTFAEIERFGLGSGNDLVDGRASAIGVRVHAGSGADTLLGGAGNDSFIGGIGADSIDAGGGNDFIDLGTDGGGIGDGDADVVVLRDGGGLNTLVNFDAPLDNGDGTYTGVDRLDVSGLTDASGARVNTDDVVVSDTVGDGSGSAVLTFPDGTKITLQGVPVSAVSSPAQLEAIGIPRPDYIVEGTAGDDVIDAAYLGDPDGDLVDATDNQDGSDDDVIVAGAGNDSIFAGQGSDTILIADGDGADTVDGGENRPAELDVLDLSGVSTDTTVTYTAAEAGDLSYATGSVAFSGIERVQLGSGDDTVSAQTGVGAVSVGGGSGFDTLVLNGQPVDRSQIGFDDTVSGIFTPANGGAPVVFGPAEALRLSDVLATYKVGALSVEGAALSGTLGGVTFDNFEAASLSIICFARGTRIKTADGERVIEALRAGDRVLTLDNGYQPIRWIGSSRRPARGPLAPVRIAAGALGNDRDLRVSPQHRMLLRGWQANLMFGESEVLVAAKALVNDLTIRIEEGGEIEYFHMLFDRHEIVFAEGAASESFHPGQQGWKALDEATRTEILDLFPELGDGGFSGYGPAARLSLRDREARVLATAMLGAH